MTIKRILQSVTLLLLVATMIACGGKQNLSYLTSQELYDQGKVHYDNKKFVKSTEYFQTIIYNFPGEPIVDTAQYYLSMSYYGNKEYELAQVEFNRLAVNYPASPFLEHSIYLKAACLFESAPSHYGLDQTELFKALKQLEDFTIDFPESNFTSDAKALLLVGKTRLAKKDYTTGIVYKNIAAYKSALIYFQKVIDDYTDTEFADDAAFGLLSIKFDQNKFGDAAEKAADFLVVFTDSEHIKKVKEIHNQALYENGKVAFEAADFTTAKEAFENYISTYPDDNKVNQAKDYLNKISKQIINSDKGDEENS